MMRLVAGSICAAIAVMFPFIAFALCRAADVGDMQLRMEEEARRKRNSALDECRAEIAEIRSHYPGIGRFARDMNLLCDQLDRTLERVEANERKQQQTQGPSIRTRALPARPHSG